MFSRTFWRPFVGATLVALPALALLPGCGGGSSSDSGLGVYRTGINFLDGNAGVTSGNLSVTYNPKTLSTQSVSGFMEVLGPLPGTATPTTTGGAARTTQALPNSFVPAPATYQVVGTVSLSQANGTPNVNLRGAFVPQRTFTITGPFNSGQTLTLSSTYSPKDLPPTTGTLSLQVLDKPIVLAATPTPTPTNAVTATPTRTAGP